MKIKVKVIKSMSKNPSNIAKSKIFIADAARANFMLRFAIRLTISIQQFLLKRHVVLTRDLTVSGRVRNLNADPGYDSFDYVRISTLELIAHEIRNRNIGGSCAEVGVFRGHFAAYINRLFPDRSLFLFDTFEGFPNEHLKRDFVHNHVGIDQDFSSTSVEAVLSKMPHPEQCKVHKGIFPATAKGIEEGFAFVSLDADLFEPIYEGLCFFFPRLERGGVILVHDYNNVLYGGAREAVNRFILEHKPTFIPIADHYGSIAILK